MDSLISLLVIVGMIAGMYKVFEKMGIAGWKAIVPILNIWVLLEEFKRPPWFIMLLMVPFANFWVYWVICDGIAKGFGKGTGYTFGIFFLSFIFLPILGFTDAKYTKQA